MNRTPSSGDLWARLDAAHAAAGAKHAEAAQASRDRGALVHALVSDGATYQAVGDRLGMSKARAHTIHKRYLATLE